MARWSPPPWRRSRSSGIRSTVGRTGSIRSGSGRTTRRRTTMPRYKGLRQRYLALLVPAVTRINREMAGRDASQRAGAVRQAIDTCLLRAAAASSTSSSSIIMDPIIPNPNHFKMHKPRRPIPSPVKRLCPNSFDPRSRLRKQMDGLCHRLGHPNYHGHVHPTTNSLHVIPHACHVMAHTLTIIPTQADLRKLQSVLIPPNKFESMNRGPPPYCNLMSSTGLIPSLGTNDSDHDQLSFPQNTNQDYYYYYDGDDDDDREKSLLNLDLGLFVSQYNAAIIEEEEEGNHEESNGDALTIGTDTNTDRDINPVIVLTQAAQHILAMQFQVDALQALLAD